MPLYQRIQATVLASFPDTITARAVPLPVVLFLHGIPCLYVPNRFSTME